MEIRLGEVDLWVGQTIRGDADRPNSQIHLTIHHSIEICLRRRERNQLVRPVETVSRLIPDLQTDSAQGVVFLHHERRSTADANAERLSQSISRTSKRCETRQKKCNLHARTPQPLLSSRFTMKPMATSEPSKANSSASVIEAR